MSWLISIDIRFLNGCSYITEFIKQVGYKLIRALLYLWSNEFNKSQNNKSMNVRFDLSCDIQTILKSNFVKILPSCTQHLNGAHYITLLNI